MDIGTTDLIEKALKREAVICIIADLLETLEDGLLDLLREMDEKEGRIYEKRIAERANQ